MNLEQLKEKINQELNWYKSLKEGNYYEGKIEALEWVLEQFEEEHTLLRNS